MSIAVETDANADWLKTPSEYAISAGHPEWSPKQVMADMEAKGQTDCYLYKRLKEDPNFERKIRRQQAKPNR